MASERNIFCLRESPSEVSLRCQAKSNPLRHVFEGCRWSGRDGSQVPLKPKVKQMFVLLEAWFAVCWACVLDVFPRSPFSVQSVELHLSQDHGF